jgi:heat shock protein HtpX
MKHVLLSRQREFRADRGGATLAGTRGLIGALQRLKAAHNAPLPASPLAALGTNGRVARGLKRLFMTHPPLDERIAALRANSGA